MEDLTRGAKYPGVSSTQEFIHLAAQHIDNADMLNKRYAPFIAKEIFENYKELSEQAFSIISLLDLWDRFQTENVMMLRTEPLRSCRMNSSR